MNRALFAVAVLVGCLLPSPTLQAKERQWHAEKGYRWADLDVPANGKTGFTLLTPEETGVFFTNHLDDWSGAANRVLYNGSGVAIGDFDNDGLPDFYICGLNTPNALYKNMGNWKFKDVTRESGILCTNKNYRAAVFADLNGDGWLDLLIATTGSGFLCFSNNQNGTFTDVTKVCGFTSTAGTIGFTLADIDGNGTLDLYAVNNRSEDIRDKGQVDIQMVRGKLVIPPWYKDRLLIMDGRLAEYGEPDMLFLNKGNGQFKQVDWLDGTFLDEDGKKLTEPPRDWGLTATFRDINNDGLPDLYVCNDYWSPDRIWINDGKGHFRAIDRLAVRNTPASSMGLDMADIDRDGYLDIFATDMLSRSASLRKRQMFAQNPMSCAIGDIEHRPQFMRNTLMHNRGDGTFEEIANYANVPASDWSWMGMFLDIDLDGYEDILIPAGHIKDVQDLDANAQIAAREASKPREKVRLNKDGKPMTQQEMFTEDKMINGRFYPRLEMPLIAYRNLGNCQFEEVSSAWGTESLGVHHGLAYADFDGDGDMDLIVNNLNSAARLYRNNSSAPRVSVRLKGRAPNTQGIGSKIRLLNGAVPLQWQEIKAGGYYLCGSEAMITFAAGKSASMRIEVAWCSGAASVIEDAKPNRIYEIDETGSQPSVAGPPAQPVPAFKDVSELVNHVHHEVLFDDFQWQPLLPKRLSQLGPGVSCFDLDGDGHDDLVIGTGRGGAPAIYKGDGKGGFTPMPLPAGFTLPDDVLGLAAWTAPGNRMLFAGLANYESDTNTPTTIGLLLRNGGGSPPVQGPIRNGDGSPPVQGPIRGGDGSSPAQSANASISTQPAIRNPQASTGPLAVADVDGDGNLDVFIGGRAAYPFWPTPVPSQIYRYNGKAWVLDQENSALLANVGLVSGALWSDLDGDGWPDLLLACEWGPIRVFKNNHGKLQEITKQLGLDKFIGWWTGIATGDFDGDGKLDIVAGNWGLNSPYQASQQHPLQLFYGNLSGRGLVEIIETEYDPELKKVVPRRPRPALAAALPQISEKFPTYKAYSEASVQDILAVAAGPAQEVHATTLATTMFLNRGDHFEAVELPREAQWAPAFAVCVADFDGDGREDIFLSQNFFATQPEVPRLDAGRGLYLHNEGGGKFRPVPGQTSGIKVYGEQRGAAVADFNEDGRPDLVVSQNGAATKVFLNVTAKPGLRVRLAGPAGNPCGIGAALRLLFGQKAGPVRELHAGAGYFSQDSLTQVLATPSAPTQIWVRWPGGQEKTSDIPANAKEISVSPDGKVQVLR